MQTFGMIVTAEPYFAVTQPGDEVVAENAIEGGGELIEARYELLARGVYSSSNTKIENAIFGIDRKTSPVDLQITFGESPDLLSLMFEYNTDIFGPRTIDRFRPWLDRRQVQRRLRTHRGQSLALVATPRSTQTLLTAHLLRSSNSRAFCMKLNALPRR